jgi:Fic family protein
MARIVRRQVRGNDYAYLEEDIFYGSKRSVIRFYLGPYEKFRNYDPYSREAANRMLFRIISNINKSRDAYEVIHLRRDAIPYLEFTRYLIRVFNRIMPQNEIENYAEHFYTQYVHGTSAIEGNTCTLRDTDLILNESISVGGKELREIYEIKNYGMLRKFVEGYRGDITLDFIKKINDIILHNIDESKGNFRNVPVFIRGSVYEPPPAAVVEDEMEELISWYSNQRKENLHPVEMASLFHQRFEEIHPFAEGNGRTGREILNFMLKRNGFPSIFFGTPEREQYLDALDSGNSGNHIQLIKFVSWRVFESARKYRAQIFDQAKRQEELTKGITREKKQELEQSIDLMSRRLDNSIVLAENGMKKKII